MRFPLTAQLLDEARRFELRSACGDCFYFREGHGCAHDWPDEGQSRWPLDAPDADGKAPTDVAFCKEFELR
ncbi:MAG TPA: hypothetical protein VGM88_03405 [Kofleriaceae bacterium]